MVVDRNTGAPSGTARGSTARLRAVVNGTPSAPGGPSEIAGKKLEGVSITDSGQSRQVTVYVDPASKLIVAKRFTASVMGPPAETDEVYSDYRDVNGIQIPFKTVTSQEGKPRTEMTVSEAKINPGVEDSAFKKP